MIKAKRILLYCNALLVIRITGDINTSWDLLQWSEDMAGRILARHGREARGSLALLPSKNRPGKALINSRTYQEMYRANVLSCLGEIDGIVLLPGLGDVGKAPDWLLSAAEKQYIPVAPLMRYLPDGETDLLFQETGRKRMQAMSMVKPIGRYGRGGREK